MERLLDVTIPGQPCGKARHRTRIVKPKGREPFVTTYVDEKDPNVTWERFASGVFASAWKGRELVTVPVQIYVVAIAARPASVTKGLGRGRLWRMSKPDGDNVLKAIADALVQGGVLADDKIAARQMVDSLTAADGEAPHTRVIVDVLDPLPIVPWPAKVRGAVAPASSGTLL